MENQQAQSHCNNIDVLGKKEDENQGDAVMVDLNQSKDKNNNNGGHHTTIEELPRTRSHASSSSDEEVEGEERKRKKKKGLKETIIEKLSGEKEDHEVQDTTTPQNIEVDDDHEAPLGKVEAATHADEDKSFLERMKDKLNGHQKTEDTTQAASIPDEHNAQHVERKGILEKIKEKLPGHHKSDEDNDILQKEKLN